MGLNTINPFTSIIILSELVPFYEAEDIPFGMFALLFVKKEIEAEEAKKIPKPGGNLAS